MSNMKKKWLIVAAALCAVGIIICCVAMTVLGWDFRKLSTQNEEINTHKIDAEYSNISIDTSTFDVEFLPSVDGKTTVVCHETDKIWHSVAVKEGTLYIEQVDERMFYDCMGVSFYSSEITVYLPVGEYGALSVKCHTGDVEIPSGYTFESVSIDVSTGDVECAASSVGALNIKTTTGDITLRDAVAGSVSLSTSTGDVETGNIACAGDIALCVSTGEACFKNVSCKNFISDGTTGDITLKNVIASERFDIERNTGDVELYGCDAAKIRIETSTGDVSGSLLSEKIFIIKTDTGEVDVPRGVSGGECEIETDTGDIEITIG